jgi:hypothetical protein
MWEINPVHTTASGAHEIPPQDSTSTWQEIRQSQHELLAIIAGK